MTEANQVANKAVDDSYDVWNDGGIIEWVERSSDEEFEELISEIQNRLERIRDAYKQKEKRERFQTELSNLLHSNNIAKEYAALIMTLLHDYDVFDA